MNSCCTVPRSAGPAVCALCGGTGKPVDRRTVVALVRPDLRSAVPESQHYFLETRSCDVVYFTQVPPRYFFTSDLTVRVGSKVTEDPVKANECACEVKNPAGRCCLGNVTKAIQKAQRLASPAE